MRISTTHQIDGGRISATIAHIEAVSNWHAATGGEWTLSWREHALRDLIRRAEDVDADAIIDVEFEVDGGEYMGETGASLARVRAKGTAVKLCA
jgi:uncharacterized protein YbjQ (UPF0145 family)